MRETAGESRHDHRPCDCKVLAGFDGLTEVEGYDPDEYLGLYSEARSRLGGNPSASEISREIEAILAERESGYKVFQDGLYAGDLESVLREAAIIKVAFNAVWDVYRRTGDFESSVNEYLGTLAGTGSLSAEPGTNCSQKRSR